MNLDHSRFREIIERNIFKAQKENTQRDHFQNADLKI